MNDMILSFRTFAIVDRTMITVGPVRNEVLFRSAGIRRLDERASGTAEMFVFAMDDL